MTYRIRHTVSGRFWDEYEWVHVGQGWQDQEWTPFRSILAACDEIAFLTAVVHIPADLLTVEAMA